MKLLIAAVLFTFFQAPAPVQGRKSDSSSEKRTAPDKRNTGTQKSESSQQNEVMESLIKEIEMQQQKEAQENQSQRSHANLETEVQGVLVKYTKALVWVGGLQALVLLFTLCVIYMQVKTMRDSERAWVLVKRVGNPAEGWLKRIPGYSPGIVFDFNVYGKTPVKVSEVRFLLEPVSVKKDILPREPDLPEAPDYSKAEAFVRFPEGGMMYAPENAIQLRSDRYLAPKEYNDLNDGKTILCAYGFIKYTDAFGGKRETRACYVYHVPRGGILKSPDGTVLDPEGFQVGGPSAYNKAT